MAPFKLNEDVILAQDPWLNQRESQNAFLGATHDVLVHFLPNNLLSVILDLSIICQFFASLFIQRSSRKFNFRYWRECVRFKFSHEPLGVFA
jgi:hypothetical protein